MDRKKAKGHIPSNILASQRVHLMSNLKLDNGVEEVLHALCSSQKDGTDPGYLGLEKKTKGVDTILHRVVHATVEYPADMDLYMQLVDVIAVKSVTWWCSKKKVMPTDDNSKQKYKHDAMAYLLVTLKDKKDRSVWKTAFEAVSVHMIRKLLFLDGVTCCRNWDGMYFDLSQFARDWSLTSSNCILNICGLYCNFERTEPGLSTLLKNAKNKQKVTDVLSIKPITKLVSMYSSFTTKLYSLIVLLHLAYMSIFSYAGCDLMDSTNSHTSFTTKALLYGIGVIEPIVLSFYLFCEVPKCMVVMCGSSHNVDKTGYMKRFLVRFSVTLVYTVLVCVVISRVDSEIRTIDRNVLSVSLLIGWLLTFSLADGIQPIHFFFRLVIKVLATDVLKVLLVYVIFLTGFSLAIHAQFISTYNITSTYHTPIQTMFLMFDVMMGLDKAIDDNREQFLDAARASVLLSKLLYIGYSLCCSIILINLLIAMMNTSYSKIREEHSAEWVCDAALFGIRTSQFFPALAKTFGVKYVHYGNLFKNKAFKEKWLYLVVGQGDLEEDEGLLDTSSASELDLLQVDNDVILSEIRLRNQINEISSTQKKMLECIQDLQAQISNLKSDNPKYIHSNDERY